MLCNPKFNVFSTAVTLKIRSRSSIPNQFFVMSQLCIHKNLERIQLLVHKILSANIMQMLTQQDPHQKHVPLPVGKGTNADTNGI